MNATMLTAPVPSTPTEAGRRSTTAIPEWAVTPAKVEAAITRIAAAVGPTRIVAFGSRARGEAHADSDLDLLVILPRGRATTGVTSRLYALLSDLLFGKDLLVTNEEGFEERCTWLGSLYRDAAREGLDLYADGATDPHAARQVSR